MPSRWLSRPKLDGMAAGERSLAGHFRPVDILPRIADNSRARTKEQEIGDNCLLDSEKHS